MTDVPFAPTIPLSTVSGLHEGVPPCSGVGAKSDASGEKEPLGTHTSQDLKARGSGLGEGGVHGGRQCRHHECHSLKHRGPPL